MKKIVSVSMVKNESDIIESFCRHTLTFCDEMLICDDHSTDNTHEIIMNLHKEGLNIQLFTNNITHGYYQATVTNNLLSLAADSYGADMLLPLDADEFLLPKPNCAVNPREILESLPNDSMYTYSADWTHFIPTVFNRSNTVFLPQYFGQYCGYINAKPEGYHNKNKAIICSRYFKECKASANQGNHNFFTEKGSVIEKKNLPQLMLAHLPYRSVEQLVTKSVIGWTNNMCMPDHKTNSIHSPAHWHYLHEIIKSEGWINEAYVQDAIILLYAKKIYSADDFDVKLNDYVWDSNIKLKYTNYEESQKKYLSFLLVHYERIMDYFIDELNSKLVNKKPT